MSEIVAQTNLTFDVNVEDTLLPLIEAMTGKQGQDAIECFTVACVENFLEPQPILDAIFLAKKAQSGH